MAGHSGEGRALLQIEIPQDDSRPDRIHVIGGFLCTFNALGARQQVLFNGGKFGFVHYHSKVVALKIVIGNVVHASLVFGTGERNRCVPGSAPIDGTIRGGNEGGGEDQAERRRRRIGALCALPSPGCPPWVHRLVAERF